MASSASLPTIGQYVEELQEFVRIVHLIKLFSLSSMVLYIYNYVLTLDREVSIMWKANLGFGKAIYFILRYCTLFSTLFINIGLYIPGFSAEMQVFPLHSRSHENTNSIGTARNIFYWVSAVVIALATDFALQLRVYALYQGSRKILCLLMISSLAMVTSFATFLVIILSHEHEKMTNLGPGSDLYICEGSILPPVYDKIWVAKLVNEALLFMLALRKGFASLREYRGSGAASRLTVLLVKDSALYFFVVFAFCLMSQLVWSYAGQNYVELPVGLALAVGSIMSQKLLVNIRMQVVDKAFSTTGSDMQYVRPTEHEYTIAEETAGLGTFSPDA